MSKDHRLDTALGLGAAKGPVGIALKTILYAVLVFIFAGPLIANNGFDRASANAAIGTGTADAVSFGAHFVANPDLVTRFALGRELASGDPATYYSGGTRGYVDYPASEWGDPDERP